MTFSENFVSYFYWNHEIKYPWKVFQSPNREIKYPQNVLFSSLEIKYSQNLIPLWYLLFHHFYKVDKLQLPWSLLWNFLQLYTVINAFVYKLGKEFQNSFINLDCISVDCTVFLLFKSFINLVIGFNVTGWNVKVSSEFFMCLLIQVMLGWLLYLSIIFSKGSSEVSVLLKRLWLLYPCLGTIFTKFWKIYLSKFMKNSNFYLVSDYLPWFI